MDRSVAAVVIALSALGSFAQAGMLSDKAVAADSRHETFVEGSEGWRFLPADLRFADRLGSSSISSVTAPAVGAIADFASQLKDAGISLVVVPVPPKALVQGAALGVDAAEEERMRAGWKGIIDDLGSHGVQVIDLLPEYSAAQEPVFCLRDTHWSGPGIAVAAARLLPAMKSAGLPSTEESGAADGAWKETSINGDLGGGPENVKLRFRAAGADAAAKTSLLLLGDSHVLVFHQGGDLHTSGAGLPEQLSAMLGGLPQVIGVRGSGATSSRLQLARRIRSEPGYLEGTKMIVWVFAGREFTEADMWKKIPLFPRKQGS